VSKSTEGNLFGSYLKGKAPKKSWDDRREQAQVGGDVVIAEGTRRSEVSDASPKAERARKRILDVQRQAEKASSEKRRAHAKPRKRAQAKAQRLRRTKERQRAKEAVSLKRKSEPRAEVATSVMTRSCAVCKTPLSRQQVEECLARTVFMGHVYCENHAEKLLEKFEVPA
jgi:hypothetical protein